MADKAMTTTGGAAPQRQVGLQRETMDGSETSLTGEVGQSAAIAHVTAQVQASFLMARRFPRDMEIVKERVLADCRRPRFADRARFSVPRGKKQNEQTGKWEDNFIEGWSIRFAEALVQSMGNIDVETLVIQDDDEKQVLRVIVRDLERNTKMGGEVTVAKTVERKKLSGNQKALATRENSYGDVVYIVQATDDDLVMKRGAAVSKLMRTCVLRMAPAWLLEEAEELVEKTLLAAEQGGTTDERAAARQRMVDAFAKVGVTVEDLKKYLGHDIAKLNAKQGVELKGVLNALAEGHQSWKDILDAKLGVTSADAPSEPRAPKPETAGAVTEERLMEIETSLAGASTRVELNKVIASLPKAEAAHPDVEALVLKRAKEVK